MILKQFTNLPKLVLVLCLALWGMSGVAQSTSGSTPDYDRWAATASMAQDSLASGTATEDFLTELRVQLTLRRSEFVAAQDADTARLDNLRIQLAALGPRPDDGVELVDIASRRKELSTEIEILNAPRIRAKEAFERADGVIREIDAALSAQQAQNLMRLRVSPLDVRIWPAAIVQLVEQFKAITNGVSTAWDTPMVQEKVRDKMPLIIALFVVAALLMTQGRRWMGQVTLTFRRYEDAYAVKFASYLRSLGQLAITILSLYLIVRAWDISRLYGNNLGLLLGTIIWIFAPFIISIWVAKRLFPKEEQAKSPVSLQASLHPQARTLTQFLGLILSAELLMIQ